MGLQDARRQAYLNQLVFLRQVAEENYKLELTRRQVEREDAIEDAKASEIIADHEAKTREHGLRGRPSPPPLPPPPPPPAPAPVDEAIRRRQEAQQKAKEKFAVELDAFDVAADAAEEKVTRCKAKCNGIYQNLDMRAGEKRARIQDVLDSFGFAYDILPISAQELMEDGFKEKEL